MSKGNLTSLNILQIVGHYLDSVIPVLSPLTPDNNTLISILKNDTSLDENFIHSEVLIPYLQSINLLSLTQFGGINVPEIREIKHFDNEINLYWANGVLDTFKMGVFDLAYKKFLRTSYKKLFETYLNIDAISPTIITDFNLKVLENQSTILTLIETIDIILNKDSFSNFFNKNLNQELLFLLLSSLSVESLNALFTQISPEIPKDLTIKTNNQNKVNAQQFFAAPCLDISLLIEKVSLFYNLSFLYDNPLLQETVQKKIIPFLSKLLSGNTERIHTLHNLNNVKRNQLLPRKSLNDIFIKHFDKTLQTITTVP